MKPTESTPAEQFAYVPVSSTLIQVGLYVTGAGCTCVAPGSPYPQKGHPELYDFTWRSGRVLPEFQFVFISGGCGEFETKESGRLEVEAGALFVLQPDTWHRYRPSEDEGWTEYWISVNGDLIYDWQNRGLLDTAKPLIHVQHPDSIIGPYQAIIKACREQAGQLPTSVAADALMIMTSVMDHHSVTKVHGDLEKNFSPIVSAAMGQIWNHSHRQISVTAIAQRLSVVRRTLERAFLKDTGRSIHDELMTCRLERAKRLLAETQVAVKAIAFAAGFSSVSSMSRVFRRELEITPSDYRKSIRDSKSSHSRRAQVKDA